MLIIKFNITKFCKFTGEYSDLNHTYNIVYIVMFTFIGFVIVLGNSFVFITVIRKASFRHRRNIFLVSLILSDLLYGLTFIPLFVLELSSRKFRETCTVRSWRVVAFMYFFSVRFLSVFFISLYTYIRTCKTHTGIEMYFNKYIHVINVLVVWLLTLILIIVLGFTPIPTDKVLATLIYTYFIVSMICIVAAYLMTLSAISRAKERSETKTYTEAIDFVRWILTWFLSTNIPLALCGVALLVFAYNTQLKHAYTFVEHHIFIVCIAVASLDAIANPIVYLRKCKEFREQLIILFPKLFKDANNKRRKSMVTMYEKGSKPRDPTPPITERHIHDMRELSMNTKHSNKNECYEKEITNSEIKDENKDFP